MAAKLKALQQWCKVHTEGYRDVSVTNMTSSWKSGLAFCALIHRFRPDLIDYDSLSKENVYDNNKLAFDTAKNDLGIPALLDAEDMVAMTVPDRLCIITYVSQYLNYFRDKEPVGGPGVKARTAVKRPPASRPSSPPGDNPKTSRSGNELPDAKVGRADSVSTPNKRSTIEDVCSICRTKVYVLERHMEDSKLYHRRCLRERQRSFRSPPGSYRGSRFGSDKEKGKENQKPSKHNTSQPSAQGLLSKVQGGPQPYRADRPVTASNNKSQQPTVAHDRSTPMPKASQAAGTSTSKSREITVAAFGSGQTTTAPSNSDSITGTDATTVTRSGPLWSKSTPRPGQSVSSTKPASATSSTALLKSLHAPPLPYTSTSDASRNVTSYSVQFETKPDIPVSRLVSRPTASTVSNGSPTFQKYGSSARSEEPMDADGPLQEEPPPVNMTTYPKSALDGSSTAHGSAQLAGQSAQSENVRAPFLEARAGLKPTSNASSQNKATVNGLLQSLAKVRQTVPQPSTEPADSHSRTILEGTHTSGEDAQKDNSTPRSILKGSSSEEDGSLPQKSVRKYVGLEDQSGMNRKGFVSKPILRPQDAGCLQEDVGVEMSHGPPRSILKMHPSTQTDEAAPKPILKPGDPTPSPPFGSPPRSILKSSLEEEKHNPRSILKNSSECTERETRDRRNSLSPSRSILKVSSGDSPPDVSRDSGSAVPVKSILKSNSRPSSPNQQSCKISAPATVSSDSGITPLCQTESRGPDSMPLAGHSSAAQQDKTLNKFSAFNLMDSMDLNAKTSQSPKMAWQLEVKARQAKPEVSNPKPAPVGFRPAIPTSKPVHKNASKPEWLVEAEHRNAARAGKYDSPEPPLGSGGAVSIDRKNRRTDSPKISRKSNKPLPKVRSSQSSPKLEQKVVSDTPAASNTTITTMQTKSIPVIPARPKRPNTYAKTSDSKPEWQVEAEKRRAARGGKYVDPEKNPQRHAAAQSSPGMPSYGGMDTLSVVQKNIERRSPVPSPAPSPPSSPLPSPRRGRDTSPPRKPSRPPPPIPEQHPAGVSSSGGRAFLQEPTHNPYAAIELHQGADATYSRKKIVPDVRFSFGSEDFDADSGSGHTLNGDCTEAKERTPPPRPPLPSQLHGRPLPPLPCCDTPKRRVNAEVRLSMASIVEQLEALDATLQCLEKEGIALEDKIRAGPETEETDEDDLMVKWFELVNQKNELVRKESDLMYRQRQQELEDLHEELEYELRCLMDAPDHAKTASDKVREKALLQELLDTVSLRNSIVDNIEEDRIRYIEEDQEIAEKIAMREFKEQPEGKKKGKDRKQSGRKNWKGKKDKKKGKGNGKTGTALSP